MQVFEFHFNPPPTEKHHAEKKKSRHSLFFEKKQEKGDLVFDSFCYDPENIFEKKAGSLYMAGLLKNALSNNFSFIGNLARTIKDKYYKQTGAGPEKCLKESLKKANEYLDAITKKGDVSWLGNISFAALSLGASPKGYELNFTKVGDAKIFLLRNGHLIEVDQQLKFEGIEPYPLKVFGNIASGKLIENDVVLVLTQEVFDTFQDKNIIFDISKIQTTDPLFPGRFDHRKLKEILNAKKEDLLKIRGVFLAVVLSQDAPLKEKGKFSEAKSASFLMNMKNIGKIFPIGKIKMPAFNWRMPTLKTVPPTTTPKTNKPVSSATLLSLAKLPKIELPDLSAKKLRGLLNIRIPLPAVLETLNGLTPPKSSIKNILLQKNSGLVLLFVVLLMVGFFVFQQRERRQIAQYRQQFGQIQEKFTKADAYISMAQYNSRSRNQANILLKESLEEVAVLIKISPSLSKNLVDDAKALEDKISGKLYELNKLKIISDPKIIFAFDSHGFVPQKMLFFKDKLYLFTPFAENIFELSLNGEGKTLTFAKKTAKATPLSNAVLFFSKSGEFASFAHDNFSDIASLKNPYVDFAMTDVISYYGNLYVLDKTNGALVKYPYIGNINKFVSASSVAEMKWADPQIWLKNESISDIKSITIDSSVWALTTDDKIQRYYAQKFQGDLKFDIFPAPKNFSKIFTSGSLPYLYLSESGQKRIVILNKSGQIESQIQSESFDNLLDFAVSENGKTIYILNGLKVYQIDL